LESRGIKGEKKEKLLKIIKIKGEPQEILEEMKKLLGDNEGINELQELLKSLVFIGRDVTLDLSLVRGLDYYTSTIFEVMSKDERIGSIAGGGRYDKMIGKFAESKEEIPAVGVALGIERIIDLLKEREKEKTKTYTKVFVANVKDEMKKDCLKIAKKLRKSGINTQIDVMGRDLRSQLNYANSLGIPYTIVIGPKEIKSGKFVLKNMKTGEEKDLSLEEILEKLS